jgi:hypothetical protein
MTRLPIDSLVAVPPWRFRIVCAALFPGRDLPREPMLEKLRALDARLVEIARARRIAIVAARRESYGLDPIHVARKHRVDTWTAVLAALGDPPKRTVLDHRDRMRVRAARPEWRRFFGMEQRRSQPSALLSDGTSLAWY